MPVTTSKQAMQANTAPAKNKQMSYKQKKHHSLKNLQSTELFLIIYLQYYSIFVNMQVKSTQVSSIFAMEVSSVGSSTIDLAFK